MPFPATVNLVDRYSLGLERIVRLVQTAQVRQLISLGGVPPESSAQTGLL
jgi:hypothetical protein